MVYIISRFPVNARGNLHISDNLLLYILSDKKNAYISSQFLFFTRKKPSPQGRFPLLEKMNFFMFTMPDIRFKHPIPGKINFDIFQRGQMRQIAVDKAAQHGLGAL